MASDKAKTINQYKEGTMKGTRSELQSLAMSWTTYGVIPQMGSGKVKMYVYLTPTFIG